MMCVSNRSARFECKIVRSTQTAATALELSTHIVVGVHSKTSKCFQQLRTKEEVAPSTCGTAVYVSAVHFQLTDPKLWIIALFWHTYVEVDRFAKVRINAEMHSYLHSVVRQFQNGQRYTSVFWIHASDTVWDF